MSELFEEIMISELFMEIMISKLFVEIMISELFAEIMIIELFVEIVICELFVKIVFSELFVEIVMSAIYLYRKEHRHSGFQHVSVIEEAHNVLKKEGIDKESKSIMDTTWKVIALCGIIL